MALLPARELKPRCTRSLRKRFCTDGLAKQMMHRVDAPVRETRGDDIGAGCAQIIFRNCVRQTDRAHAGGARSLNSRGSVFDHQTLTRLKRQLADAGTFLVKQLKRALVTI